VTRIRAWLAACSWEFVTAHNAIPGIIVAGVSTGEEEKAFREFCESMK
jgi:hypothetical protein